MLEILPLFGGLPGGPELLVILLIAVLLFGANKIPKLARSTGEAMGEFKKGREEVEQELQEIREGASPEGTTESTATTGGTGEGTTEDPSGTTQSGIQDAESDTEQEQA